jgi:sporulation protein YlmC with PRC-barrel domain
MSTSGELDLAYGVLDHQLVDSEGRRCGKVDELELDGKAGENLRVVALLVGPGAWRARLPGPLPRLAGRLFARQVVRGPWEAVESVEAAVHLSNTASELGLGRGDDRWRKRIARIPGS